MCDCVNERKEIVKEKYPDKKYPCDSRKIYDLHEEYGYIVTPADFYCRAWREESK